VWARPFAIAVYNPQAAGYAVNWRSLTVLGELEDFGTLNALLRLQYFIATATALWFLASGDKSEPVRAA
jgi:hypothetical protein